MNYVETFKCIRINAPDLYNREDFQAWIKASHSVATWYNPSNPPDEMSDIFVTYDHGDGSDSDMPGWADVAKVVQEKVGQVGFAVVWLTNLES